MTEIRNSNSDTLSEQPPEEVRAAAHAIRPDDIRGIVRKHDVFPPHLLSLTEGGAGARVNHIVWVIRYYLAHPDSGLESFRGTRGKRKKSCKWAADETTTSFSQIQQEIATIYASYENPQQAFEEDLAEFARIFERHRSHC